MEQEDQSKYLTQEELNSILKVARKERLSRLRDNLSFLPSRAKLHRVTILSSYSHPEKLKRY